MSGAGVLSVVVPTRDRPAQLGRCLAALALGARPEGVEVIVVDDGSVAADAGEVVGAIAPRLEARLLRIAGAGPAAARNAGACVAAGDHVAFTDDDCVPDPGWLAQIERLTAAAPEAVIGGPMAPLRPGNRYADATQALLDYLYAAHNGVPGQARFLTSNNLVLPRGLLLDVGGFDERFLIAAGEDRDLVARLAAGGGPIVFAPELVVAHDHPPTLSAFVRQNVRYGRGARRYRAPRADAPATEPAVAVEPAGFYVRLVTHRLRRTGGLPTAALLAASQLAVAAGYALEAVRPARRSSCASRTPEQR